MSTMSDAAGKSAAVNWGIYNEAQQNLAPYRQLGGAAAPTYGSYLGLPGYADIDPTQALRETPGYNWMLGQGTEAIDRSAAGKGMLGSGAVGKGLMTFGEGLADQTYQNYMNRLWQTLGLGQQTSMGQGQLGMQMAGNVQNALMNAAQTDTQMEAMQNRGGLLNSILGGVGLLGSLALTPVTGGASAAGGIANSLVGRLAGWK